LAETCIIHLRYNGSTVMQKCNTQTRSVRMGICSGQDTVRKQHRKQLATNKCARDVTGDFNGLLQKCWNVFPQ